MKKSPVAFTSESSNPNYQGVTDIEPAELSQLTSQVHLIDVRRPDEYTGELGHIDGAKLIVLDTLPDQIDSLPKDEPIVFICKGGSRSAQATAFAKQNGFSQVYNMKGGMMLWNSLGLPIRK